jgi:hypothetical protein
VDRPAAGPERSDGEQRDECVADDVLQRPDAAVRDEGSGQREHGGRQKRSEDQWVELHRGDPTQLRPASTLGLVEASGLTVLSHDIQAQLEGGREVEFLWVLAQKR